MGLLMRPMRHVAGADIARENFLARHFRDGVNPVFQDAVATIPGWSRQQRIFEQGSESPRSERREIHRDATDQARAKHLPTRRARREAAAMLLPVRLHYGSLERMTPGSGRR
jgi:hypothetical protein